MTIQANPTTTPAPFIGQPLYSTLYDAKTGYIYEIEEPDNKANCFVIGSSGMVPAGATLKVIWDDLTESPDLPQQIAQKWLDAAHRMELEPADEATLSELRAKAAIKAADAYAERMAEVEATNKARDEFRAKYAGKIPAWAKAAIIAEYNVDESDSMSDYHGHRTEGYIILGFSKHTRDLFPELRKHAAFADETRHLSVKPEKPEGAGEYWTPDDEHREKYSMGGGYYLKDGFRNSTGWQVRKYDFYGKQGPEAIERLPVGRWCADIKQAPTKHPAKQLNSNTQAHIEQHEHTKKGFTMFMVILDATVDRDEFNTLRDQAKSMGGWYSRKWGATPGGFAFKESEAAENFLNSLSSNEPTPTQPKQSGEKFRAMADKLENQIADKLAPRQENTAKRQAQAAHARLEGERLKRTQSALYALADLHDADEVPAVLASIKTKKAVYDLMAEKTEPVPNGFHAYHKGTDQPSNDSPEALALWALLTPKSDEEKKAEALAQKVRDLQGCKIPGYFPTPAPVIDRMLDYADIKDGIQITEPSIGSAAIADRVCEIYGEQHRENIQGVECNHSLAEICNLKGYSVIQGNFLDVCLPVKTEDLILMNPPFENLQDVDHVLKAFTLLKPGGRLIAIMSPAFTFHNTSKAASFREFLESHCSEVHDIEAGAFKESGTMVSSKLVIIDKE